MHVSLDSALGRQRRLNSVGESVLQIAPNAAAAYSLRSLTGGDPKVVRVRRGSDNHEQDFTASEVSSGALTSFVNAQVVAPLDIQALSATGRDGDFLIAKAAYSLRSLGTRQATLAATGDTVARANGKFVVQVRRSSDDALKSFTADEVTDGTLLAFVGTGGSDNGFVKTWYDQSVTNQAGDTATGNHATQATAAEQPKIVNAGSLVTGGLDFDGGDSLSVSGDPVITASSSGTYSAFSVQTVVTSEAGYLYGNASASNGSSLYAAVNTFTLSNQNFATFDNISRSSGQNLLSAVYNNGDAGLLVNGAGTMTDSGTYNFSAGTSDFIIGNRNGGSASATFLTGSINEIIVYNSNQTDNRTAIEANIGEAYSIDLPSGVDPGFDQVDGFVETWYDQSGNSKDAVQATAGSQPKIVNAGTLLNELDFDGTDDSLAIDFGADLSQANSIFIVHQSDTTTATVNEFFDSVGGSNPRTLLDQSGSNYRMFSTGASVSTGVAITTDKSLIFALYNGTSSLFAKNGTATSALNAGTTDINQNSTLGSSATRFYDGTMQEVIIYNSDQSSNRVALETNINSHYSIF